MKITENPGARSRTNKSHPPRIIIVATSCLLIHFECRSAPTLLLSRRAFVPYDSTQVLPSSFFNSSRGVALPAARAEIVRGSKSAGTTLIEPCSCSCMRVFGWRPGSASWLYGRAPWSGCRIPACSFPGQIPTESWGYCGT